MHRKCVPFSDCAYDECACNEFIVLQSFLANNVIRKKNSTKKLLLQTQVIVKSVQLVLAYLYTAFAMVVVKVSERSVWKL